MENNKPGAIKRCWTSLKQPSTKYSLLALLVTGFFAGVVFWGGFNTSLEATNTLEFCISCHEMQDTVYQEYKETIHYSNRTGVRVVCSDCHVPKDLTHKLIRKARASLEVWGHLTGSIDTKEKFEAKRMELATHEWERMKSRDSIECRNCHSFDAMSDELQKQTPYKKHMKAKAEGGSCIDCHKGIAHRLPKEYRNPNESK
jgi:cytochrome c-type protein NapC